MLNARFEISKHLTDNENKSFNNFLKANDLNVW